MRALLCFLLLVRNCLADPGILITNATIIDAEKNRATPNQSILITGRRISKIAPTIDPPANARIIDATGKFAIPGLWDMHVHVLWESVHEFFPLLIANGITGVRDLHSTLPLADLQQLRRDIESRQKIGPRFLYSGPILDGPRAVWPGSIAVTNASGVAPIVERLHRGGVDFLKVYEFLSRDAYLEIVRQAKRLNLPVCGHIPQRMDLLECSDLGQLTVEHLSGVLYHTGEKNADGHREFNPAKAAPIFEKFKTNNAWHCPTFTVNVTSYRPRAEALADPNKKFLTAETIRKSLFDRNPLEDIAASRNIYAVIANGRAFSRADLDKILRDLEANPAKN